MVNIKKGLLYTENSEKSLFSENSNPSPLPPNFFQIAWGSGNTSKPPTPMYGWYLMFYKIKLCTYQFIFYRTLSVFCHNIRHLNRNNWRWRDGIFLFDELLPETCHKDEVGQEARQAVVVVEHAKVGPDQTAVEGQVLYGPGGNWRHAEGAEVPDGCEHQSSIDLEERCVNFEVQFADDTLKYKQEKFKKNIIG